MIFRNLEWNVVYLNKKYIIHLQIYDFASTDVLGFVSPFL
jgi:hypothetical protein